MLIKLRFRFPEVLLGVLLAVAIFAMGALFCSSPNPSSPTQAQSGERGSGNKQEITWWQDPVAVFTLGLVFIGLLQAAIFYGQMRLIRRSLNPAKEAADAAKLNAEAVMAAEGAHLYPVLRGDNLKGEVFRGIVWYPESGSDADHIPTPKVSFGFKNYGKTPAVFMSFMWGIDFFESPSSTRTLHVEPRGLIEVLGAGEETQTIEVEMLGPFNRAHAKSVKSYSGGELLFFGEAIFKDFFNRQFKCIWEYDGRSDGFRLVRHEEREDPDETRTRP